MIVEDNCASGIAAMSALTLQVGQKLTAALLKNNPPASGVVIQNLAKSAAAFTGIIANPKNIDADIDSLLASLNCRDDGEWRGDARSTRCTHYRLAGEESGCGGKCHRRERKDRIDDEILASRSAQFGSVGVDRRSAESCRGGTGPTGLLCCATRSCDLNQEAVSFCSPVRSG